MWLTYTFLVCSRLSSRLLPQYGYSVHSAWAEFSKHGSGKLMDKAKQTAYAAEHFFSHDVVTGMSLTQ